MSYRNITVDGTDYQYTIGKSHVKVRGLTAWPKAEVASTEVKSGTCGCGCGCGATDEYSYTVEQIKPSDIAKKIRATV